MNKKGMKTEEVKLSQEWEKIIYWMLFVIFALLIIAFISAIPRLYNKSHLENNTVINVIDGDTFEYYDADLDKLVKVRLLCVNAPEEKEEGYDEAKKYLRSLIRYKEIKMNSSEKDKDIYGRLLRYVYVNDWGEERFVNKLMIDNGYAELMIIPPENCSELIYSIW